MRDNYQQAMNDPRWNTTPTMGGSMPVNGWGTAGGSSGGLGDIFGSLFGGGGGGAMGGLGGTLGNMFGGLFGMGQKNPSDAAMGYYNQVPGTLKPYYDPYINAGHGALNTLQGQYQNLLGDPGALMNKLSSGYKASPGYQYNVDEATRGANQAAAAGGMVGSPAEQAQLGKSISGMASQDYNSYLSNVLGLYGQGLSGTQGINQMGYNASNELAQSLANSLMNQGNLAYSGQANQNQSQGGGWGSLFGGMGSLLGGLL
jgi:hypothetical protein